MLATTAIPDKEEKDHPSNDLARDPTGQTGVGTLIVMRELSNERSERPHIELVVFLF